MTEEQQKDIEQLFEAMGNSGGRFVIGQVIGSQTNYIGDHLAQKDGKPLHEDIPHSEENVDDEDETILKNIIFNSKVFDTNEKLLRLRKVIAHSIDMGEYNAMFGEPNPSTIDPDVQGVWYYLMKALEESEVAKKFSVPSFIDQMIDWYPWLFSFETPEDMQAFKRKMEKSISHEKSIWKYGKAKEVTKLKDMWARYHQANIDYAKVERMFNAAYTGLCVKLVALKQEIAKEKATR